MRKSVLSLLLALLVALALASAAFARVGAERSEYGADLDTLNGSGASGNAELKLNGTSLRAKIESDGLEPNVGHLQHIHGMAQAVSECPTLAADQPPNGNGDGLISVGEGAPFYGPIQVSFTVTGDTSAASGGALDRFPVADADGELKYSRTFGIPAGVAANLGNFAIVQHGVDANGDGAVVGPFETALPATCGKIVRK